MKNYTSVLAIALCAIMLVGCKEDKINEPEHFEGIYYAEGTPDRAYIENVASKVLSFISPNDQRWSCVGINGFAKCCEEYTFPENFHDDNSLSKDARALSECIANNDYMSLSRAASTFVYNLARFKGLYQASPNTDAWQFIENRSEVIFRYWVDKTQYEITVSGIGSEWSATYNDDGTQYNISIPKVLNLVMTSGDAASPTTQTTIKVESDGQDNNYLNLKTSVRFSNIQLESTTKATNSKMVEDMILYHNHPTNLVRTVLLSATSELQGSNLCSIKAWQNAAKTKEGADLLAQMITSGNATVMVYKSLQIKSTLSNMRTFTENVDGWWDSYDTPNPKAQAEKSANSLKSCINAQLYYCGDNQSKVRGTLGWEAYMADDWYEGQSWSVRPILTFDSDKTSYDFESYFGNGRFLNIENTYNSLLKTYKLYFN